MSFLLQKQFFQLCSYQQFKTSSSQIFNNIQQQLQGWHIQINSETSFQAFTTQYDSMMFKNLQYLLYLNFSDNPLSLNLNFFILKNYIPFKIDSLAHRIKLYGYLLKINSKISIGKFSICPKSGLLKFNAQILLSESSRKQCKYKNDTISANKMLLLDKVQDICLNFQIYLSKIFLLVNNQSIFLEKFNQQNFKQIQTNKLSYKQQIQLLQNLLPFIHEDLNYLIRSSFQFKLSQNLNIQNLFEKIIQIYSRKSYQKKYVFNNFNNETLKQIALLQKINDQKTVNFQKAQKSELLLQKNSIKKIKSIFSNENCAVDLYSGQKFINFKDFNKPKIIFRFIKKSPVSQKGQKLISRQQKFINLFISQGGKDGIAEYFEVKTSKKEIQLDQDDIQIVPKAQVFQQNSIFLAFYPNNLNQYVQKRRSFLSLNSKILLLLKLDKALSYIHCKMCQHMDLKPQNIMVDSNENIKLIDFCQSIHPKLPLSSKPGVSIPYSPPQFFSKYKFTPERCDIYSFGVMIFQMIFQQFPQKMSSKKQKMLSFYQNLSNYEKLFQYFPQKINQIGEKRLTYLISRLCMKCMSSNASLRPLQSWIRIYLKKFIQISLKY